MALQWSEMGCWWNRESMPTLQCRSHAPIREANSIRRRSKRYTPNCLNASNCSCLRICMLQEVTQCWHTTEDSLRKSAGLTGLLRTLGNDHFHDFFLAVAHPDYVA